jgi:hypothetical protein
VHPVHERVLDFIAAPDSGRFNALALEVFRHQVEAIAPYRRYCRRRGVTPEAVSVWTEVPPVPVQVFKEVEFACAPPQRRFRSSGTTRGPAARSVHALPDLRLYRAAARGGLARFLFPDVRSMRLLSLIHPAVEHPESSLAQMVDWAMQDFAAPGSAYAAAGDRLELERAVEVVRQSERDGEPLCLLATTAALLCFLDLCRERRWAFRLPHGSRLMDTGGAKGTEQPLSRRGLHHAVWAALAIPGYFFANEYGMTELSSQAWENVIADRVAGRFSHRALTVPPWLKTRILDPATLAGAAPGERGLLCHYDLANAGTAFAVLTEDVGVAVEGGFHVLGRASGAELRGCSLVWEGAG